MAARRTEAQHAHAKGLQAEPPLTVLARLLEGQSAAAAAVEAALPAIASAAEAAAGALRGGHRMAYAGAGSSGLMALADALELPGTFGIPAERAPVLFAGGAEALLHMTGAVEDDGGNAAADVERAELGPGDVAICVSASGSTPYTVAVAEAARARGASVVGIANVEASRLLALADIRVLLDTGPELVAGSTRMGAATAQKIALNMISTLAALQLGHVHDGFMVNLVADNAKLRDRAARIVAAVSGTGETAARAALDSSAGMVKPAVMIAAGARDGGHAERLLAASGGHLGPALSALRSGQ